MALSTRTYLWKLKPALTNTSCNDAFNLAPNQDGLKRTPTHYYRGEGSTLDYIFVSNALNEQNNRAVGKVVDFVVYDEHLHSDGVGNKKQSDHAQPVVRIQLNTNH